MYFGWDYQGFVVQEDSIQTIEHHLFHALTKACLIESRETSQYHRCGRTDKGVSAFGQVISLSLRSKHPVEKQDLPESITTEMQYSKILNRLLPKDIRVVAWMPIPKELPEYSARFDCIKRTYKFYFPFVPRLRRHAPCVRALIVTISAIFVKWTSQHLCTPLVIEGNAFLWHQIRCIMGVLLLVGRKGGVLTLLGTAGC
ncbi:tRNA pseudouridine(38/39) synthase-like [Manduca sexta]|uniref:tRNA pseudouridine(38/39) synthase-like n=1 Tax=Manduca sexta TaxID=7130 RepID=UPI00189072B0|nr:tRNA pseudouridine(38/39) synthase-like [Manduca sexta]